MKKVLCLVFSLMFLFCACAEEAPPAEESSVVYKDLPECSDTADYGEMKLIVFETGKSDSVLIQTENHAVLIDTADDDDAEKITEYMRQKRIKTLDYLIITHYDNDHIGSADTVFEMFTVNTVLQPEGTDKGAYYEEYVAARDDSGAKVESLLGGAYSFKLDGVEFIVYPPQKQDYDAGTNELSMCVLIKHGNRSFMVSGDVMNERMRELIAIGDIHADFLKMPHHGTHVAMTAEFLGAVSPYYAVFTDSKANPAEQRVYDILNGIGCRSFSTENGDVVVESDGKTFTVRQK